MPYHRVSRIVAHLRTQPLYLASAMLWVPSALNFAQLSVTAPPQANFVAGQGLSPSYFLPPSTSIPAPQLPTFPSIDSESLVGSGVPSPLPSPPAIELAPQTFPNTLQASNGLPTVAPYPLDPIAKNTAPPSLPTTNSVELDLRSSNSQIASTPFANCTNRPLTPPSPWFFSANAVILNSKENQNRVFSSSLNAPSISLLETNAVQMRSTGGYELGTGRYFGSGKYALAATYWGLSPSESVSTVSASQTGPLATSLPLNVISTSSPGTTEGLFLGTTPMSDLFNNAPDHRIQSQKDFNNLELNLYWFALGGAARQPIAPSSTESQCWSLSDHPTSPNAPWQPSSSRLRLSLFSGVRWFQFQDELRYSAMNTYYSSHVRNDLWGIQSGVITHCLLTPRWSIWNNFNAGVYNNRSLFQSSAGNGGTLATIVASGSINASKFQFETSDNNASFLGESTSGLTWHFSRGWSSNIGYRILGVSGIGNAQSQIPADFRFPSRIATTALDDSLLLHGMVLGASYNF